MKKTILISLMIALLTSLCFGQVKEQSIGTQYSDTSFSITYVNDGVNNMAGIAITGLRNFAGIPKLSLDSITTSTLGKSGSTNYYTGALLDYHFYDRGGWKAFAGIGAKGLDITSLFNGSFKDLSFSSKQFIWTIGLTIPWKS